MKVGQLWSERGLAPNWIRWNHGWTHEFCNRTHTERGREPQASNSTNSLSVSQPPALWRGLDFYIHKVIPASVCAPHVLSHGPEHPVNGNRLLDAIAIKFCTDIHGPQRMKPQEISWQPFGWVAMELGPYIPVWPRTNSNNWTLN